MTDERSNSFSRHSLLGKSGPGAETRTNLEKIEAYVEFNIEKTLIQAQRLRKHDALSGAREVSTDVLRHVTLNLYNLDFESTREDL